MSNQVPYEDLVTEYEKLAKAFYRLMDNEQWKVVHMGGTYRRASIILTEDEYEALKKLSDDSETFLATLLAY